MWHLKHALPICTGNHIFFFSSSFPFHQEGKIDAFHFALKDVIRFPFYDPNIPIIIIIMERKKIRKKVLLPRSLPRSWKVKFRKRKFRTELLFIEKLGQHHTHIYYTFGHNIFTFAVLYASTMLFNLDHVHRSFCLSSTTIVQCRARTHHF